MSDDETDAGGQGPDRHQAQLRIMGFAKTFSLIDPDIEAEPALISRIRTIVDHIPEHTLSDLLDNIDRAHQAGRPSIAGFSTAHGISQAESRLLASLVDGGSVGSHARDAGISINTARTHMRRLLEKTGASNQLDLLRRYFA